MNEREINQIALSPQAKTEADIPEPILESHSCFASIKIILGLCSTTSLFFLALKIFLNIFTSILPMLYFIELSSAIDQMKNYQNDRNKYYEAIKTVCVLMFGFGVVYILIASLSSFLILVFSRRQGNLWRNKYFAALLAKSPAFYDKHPELASGASIDMECAYIEEALGDDLMLCISGASLLVGMWILAMVHSLELTFTCLIIFPVQYFAVALLDKENSGIFMNTIQLYKLAGMISEETLCNIKTVSSLNCQQSKIQEYSGQLKPVTDASIKEGVKNGIGWGVTYSIVFAVNGVMLYVATIYIMEDRTTWVQGKIKASGIIIVFYCFFMASTLIGIFLSNFKKIKNGLASAKHIKRITHNPESTYGSLKLADTPWEIKFIAVKFRYPSKPEIKILRSISFNIPPGRKIGLVGRTGCGKSTIAQVLLGFYTCKSGSIQINQVEIKDLNLKSLRASISYVNQEPLLFSTTIRKNIKLGGKECSEEEIMDAASCSEALSFIEKLPLKMDSYVGNKGSLLSGGEKQRIALARAFIRNPKLLILDEATSAMDAITESKILNNIRDRYLNTSVLVIAQRTNTIKNLDDIYFIEEGKILESGTYSELVKAKGSFFQLINKDLANSDENPDLSVLSSEESKNSNENENVDVDELQKIDSGYSDNPDKVKYKVPLLPLYYPLLIISILISSGISGVGFPLFGYYFSQVLINIFRKDPRAKEESFAIMFYLIADSIIILVFFVILYYSLAKLFGKYTEKLRYETFSSLVFYDAAFYDKKENTPHRLSDILREESQKTSSFGGPALAIPLLLVFAMIGGFILGMTIDPIFCSIYTGIIILDCIVLNKSASFFNGGFKKHTSEKLADLVNSSLTNYKTVTALNLQKYFFDKYNKELTRQMKDNTKIFVEAGFLYSLRFGIEFLFTGAILFIGAYLVKINIIEIDVIYQVMQTLNSSTWILIIISVLIPDITAAVSASQILGRLASYIPSIDCKSAEGSKSPISGEIEFSNVCFSYAGSKTFAINNCSFTINPGENIGITGISGSGKSTVAMLLLRLYNPLSGVIYIDGIEINQYNIAYIRDKISWVGQEPVLFKGSILQNLRLGNENLSHGDALAALEKAQAMDIIELYGIETDVGVRGSLLSGGQKQRIAIARAIARKPSILILDEATSALDNITEENMKNIFKLENITVISIAHRLGSIRNSDRIIVIHNGSIQQQGDHRRLSLEIGIYRDLLKNLV